MPALMWLIYNYLRVYACFFFQQAYTLNRLIYSPLGVDVCNMLSALLAAVTTHHAAHAHRAGSHDGLHHLACALELLEEFVHLRK